MLKYPHFKKTFLIRAKSGFYFDFFLKKLLEVFVRNFFVYTSLFFGEKFLIEVLTKKVVNYFLINSNKIIGWSMLNQKLFFIQFLIVMFYILFALNVYTIFL